MLHNYKSYTLILENKAREKKIKKVKDKIKKFANFPGIYDWSINKCITDRTTEGLQYAVWVANQLKDSIVSGIMDTTGYDNKKVTEDRVKKFLKGFDDKELEVAILKDWSSISSLIEGFQEAIVEDINYILDWLKNPLRDEKVNLSELSFNEAYKKSEEWHESLKATGKIEDESGKIFIEFDDGSYWIDLQTTYSADESAAMGHCGRTNDGDTLLSYRDKNKSPHITVAYDTKDGAIYQMKGRQNKKPVEKYFPYIYRLLVDPQLKPKYFAYEYLKEEDFNLSDFDRETFQKVYNYNPDLIYDSMQYDYRMMNNLIKKKYLSKEDITDILLKSEGVQLEAFLALLIGYDAEGEKLEIMFTQEELKTLYEKSDIDLNQTGELPKIILYNQGIIDDEEFANYFSELSVVEHEGKKILKIEGNEDDLADLMSDGVKSILFDEDPFAHWDFPYYKMESASECWSDLTKDTKEDVIQKMIGEEISYNYWRGNKEDYFNDVEITKEMIQWKDNDYCFVYNGKDYKIDEILDENKDESLSELYEALSMGKNEAQQIADQGEYYKKSVSAVEDELGPFKRETRTTTTHDGKKVYTEVFVFNFHDVMDDLDNIEQRLYEEYENFMDGSINYDQENYGSFWVMLRDYKDQADFNDDYGVYGDIDKSTLNDCVLYRLEDI